MIGGNIIMAKFRKSKWLAQANKEMANGILSQKDINNACMTWVDDLDGKETEEESLQKFCD